MPTDPQAGEVWLDLGFSRFMAPGVRSTGLEGAVPRPAVNIRVRRSTADDAEVVYQFATELMHSFAEPPMFIPFLPETAAERRRLVAEHLADPACSTWLASVNDRVGGLQLFQEPSSVHWHQTPLETPERTLYLFFACTTPAACSARIGATFWVHTMARARDAGDDTCMGHFPPTSRAAVFWRRPGLVMIS